MTACDYDFLCLVSVSYTHRSDLRSLLGLTVTDLLVAGEAPFTKDVAECLSMREDVLSIEIAGLCEDQATPM